MKPTIDQPQASGDSFSMVESAARALRGAPLLILGLLGGCATQSTKVESPIGTTIIAEGLPPELEKKQKPRKPPPSPTVVADAALPFTGYRGQDEKALGEEELLTYLAAADAICIGENHDNPLDHYAQLRTIVGLLERRAMRGFQLGLGLEMVRAEEQRTLSSFEDGTLTPFDFEKLARWETEWGFPFQYYEPQLSVVREGGGQLLALGVQRELTRSIAEVGIDGLSYDDKLLLPDMVPSNEVHRELFELLMKGHPTTAGQLDNYYEAQLVWDEMMAQRSARWLEAHTPSRKLIILAGTAHCHHSAIPSRIERRTGLTVVNLLPVEGGQPLISGGVESSTQEKLADGYDYQMVFQR